MTDYPFKLDTDIVEEREVSRPTLVRKGKNPDGTPRFKVEQGTEYLVATGAALVGDRLVYVKEINGIEFLYMATHTSTNFLRTPIYF